MADHISVSEALKLVRPFKGERKEVLAFISNVDTAFEVINPDNSDVLYKFVLTRISGEPRVAITHRNIENLEELRVFLKNTYTEKRTLHYHATQLFGAKQGKMIVSQSGYRAYKGLVLNLGKRPYKIVKTRNGWG